MSAPSDKNLSETLFNKVQPYKIRETSTISSSGNPLPCEPQEQFLIDGLCTPSWFRVLRRAFWIWQGAEPIELEETLARIATSDGERTNPQQIDTVQGFIPGNWCYEWSQVAGEHNRKAKEADDAGESWIAKKEYFLAARYYSIASYPHLKGDELAEQAQVQANIAYREGGRYLPVPLKELKVPFRGKEIKGYLHLPHDDHPVPLVMVTGAIDSLQLDFIRLFEKVLAPLGIGMLSLDLPGLRQTAAEADNAVQKLRRDEAGSRVAARFFQFGENVLHRRQTEAFIYIVGGLELAHLVAVAEQFIKRQALAAQNLFDHRIGFGVHAGAIERIDAAGDTQKACGLFKGFSAQARHFFQVVTAAEPAMFVAEIHQILGDGLVQTGDTGQERHRCHVDVNTDGVDAVFNDTVEATGQMALVDIVLVLADANGLGFNLHQFGERVLQPARDRHRAAQAHVQVGQFLAGEFAGRIDRCAGLARLRRLDAAEQPGCQPCGGNQPCSSSAPTATTSCAWRKACNMEGRTCRV